MITTSSIPYITQMLNDPQSITDTDNDSMKSLLEAYPYFLPARYMEAAREHKRQPFTPQMLARMQLYMGNWLLLWQYLESAIGEEAQAKYYEEHILKEQELQQQQLGDEIQEQEEEYMQEKEFVIPVAAEEEKDPADADDFIFERLKNYNAQPITAETDETLILPVYTEDYFLHQGLNISNDIPADVETLKQEQQEEDEKALMIVMSFSEWLVHFKYKNEKAKEEAEDQKALKTMWQKGKLAAAMEEENEEIPEAVFEMAVNSITKEEDLVSESRAEIYIKQGKYDKAIEMYRKLSLRNPQKNAYFARKIDTIFKVKQL